MVRDLWTNHSTFRAFGITNPATAVSYKTNFKILCRTSVSDIHINDLSLSISKLANPILFADDTTIVISNTNREEFKNNINSLVTEITNRFQSNLLTLNCNKTHFMQFLTKKQNEKKKIK